jgi:hypothetical protein
MPKPDEFGRYRVLQDTGAKFSIQREPLDGEKVLDEPASDVAGDALPVEYPKNAAKSTTNSGQQADTQKESRNG